MWDGGDDFGRHEGRAAIHAHFARVSSQIVFAGHLVVNEIIDVDLDDDSARGQWWLLMPCTVANDEGKDEARWIFASYDDRLVKRDGRWLFAHTVFDMEVFTAHKDGWAEA